ncbi:MAG: NADH-quinone oxidoreductase subunit A [Gemmatimonadota bacterium]|jgi:NADH-quinone oxidoreductase subunit A|nr:MAG: NADH-quinone oxidoreductase subunit A [Gemmatimonadota bacterium]
MTESYLGIVFLGIVGIVTAVLIIGLSQVIGHVRPSVVKGSPYESGMQPLGGTRERFSVNFYIVAMLFIVFDIETIFLLPWAVVFRDLPLAGFIAMVLFLAVLGVGLVYAWKKGALEWD